jgi:hypothetical protein
LNAAPAHPTSRKLKNGGAKTALGFRELKVSLKYSPMAVGAQLLPTEYKAAVAQ